MDYYIFVFHTQQVHTVEVLQSTTSPYLWKVQGKIKAFEKNIPAQGIDAITTCP